jgi:hypothetical protein
MTIAEIIHDFAIAYDLNSDRWAREDLAAILEQRMVAERVRVWDERGDARPQYLGPRNGHYDECMGWEDCDCASYPNPYRTPHLPQIRATETEGAS